MIRLAAPCIIIHRAITNVSCLSNIPNYLTSGKNQFKRSRNVHQHLPRSIFLKVLTSSRVLTKDYKDT